MTRTSRILHCIVLCVVLISLGLPAIRAYALTPAITLGTDTPGEKDRPTALNISTVSYANDATIYQFFISFESAPRTNNAQIYWIYLDTKMGGTGSGPYIGADYRLVYNLGGAFLYSWNESAWVKTNSAIAGDTTSLTNTLVLTGNLTDIDYPWISEKDMGVVAQTTIGTSKSEIDRAPDDTTPKNYLSHYAISYRSVPDLPLLTLPAFTLATVATISLLYKHKFSVRTAA